MDTLGYPGCICFVLVSAASQEVIGRDCRRESRHARTNFPLREHGILLAIRQVTNSFAENP
jgi:hypothetical protein